MPTPITFPCPPASLPDFSYPACGDATPAVGGSHMLIYGSKNIDTLITDVTDSAQWTAQIAAGNVKFITPILGQVPEASDTETRVQSDKPPKVTNRQRSLTFEDYNTESIDNTATYNTLEDNAGGYKWAYMGVDGNFYGWISGVTFMAKRVKDPNGDDGTTRWVGQISWFEKDEIAPVAIPDGTIVLA